MSVNRRLEKNQKKNVEKKIIVETYTDKEIKYIYDIIDTLNYYIIKEKNEWHLNNKNSKEKDVIYLTNRLRDYFYYVQDCDNKGIKNMIDEINYFIMKYGLLTRIRINTLDEMDKKILRKKEMNNEA